MQKIRIARIDVKEGDNDKGHWVNHIITGEDKSKVSTFEPSASALKVGDVIEAEIEVKGKYTNLKSFQIVEHGVVETHQQVKSKGDDNRGDSIETQTAFKGVVELLVANIITKDDALGKGAFQWAANKLGIKLDALEPKSTPVKEQVSPDVSKTETNHIDLDWVKEKIGILQGKGLKAWTNAGILSYIKTVYKVEAKTPSEAIKQLSEKDASDFEQRIKDAIEVS